MGESAWLKKPGKANRVEPNLQTTSPAREIVGRPSVAEYVRKIEVRSGIKIRTEAAEFLRRAFGLSLCMSFTVIFLQGFSLWGFHLSETFLNWLGAATVGQVAGLFAMVLRQK
jgi:hypothetical protein